jgi:hypothetical protein
VDLPVVPPVPAVDILEDVRMMLRVIQGGVEGGPVRGISTCDPDPVELVAPSVAREFAAGPEVESGLGELVFEVGDRTSGIDEADADDQPNLPFAFGRREPHVHARTHARNGGLSRLCRGTPGHERTDLSGWRVRPDREMDDVLARAGRGLAHRTDDRPVGQ